MDSSNEKSADSPQTKNIIRNTDKSKEEFFHDQNNSSEKIPLKLNLRNVKHKNFGTFHEFFTDKCNMQIANFEKKIKFVILKDLKEKKPCAKEQIDKSKSNFSPVIIGHRGAGKNSYHPDKLYNENTIAAFKKGEQDGAEFIEFDVQILNDFTPIIFHDFFLPSSSVPIYFSKITLEEFINKETIIDKDLKVNDYNFRSEDLKLCSLAQVFEKCQDVGFNIEIKYPNQDEIDFLKIKNIPSYIEYCNAILNVVNKYGKEKLYFSSFNKEVCIYLRFKQDLYDVFYLTEGKGDCVYKKREIEKEVESITDLNGSQFCLNQKDDSKCSKNSILSDFADKAHDKNETKPTDLKPVESNVETYNEPKTFNDFEMESKEYTYDSQNCPENDIKKIFKGDSDSIKISNKEDAFMFCELYDLSGVVFDEDCLCQTDITLMQKFHEIDKKVYIYGKGTNDINKMEFFESLKIDGIICDEVKKIADYFKDKNRKDSD